MVAAGCCCYAKTLIRQAINLMEFSESRSSSALKENRNKQIYIWKLNLTTSSDTPCGAYKSHSVEIQ